MLKPICENTIERENERNEGCFKTEKKLFEDSAGSTKGLGVVTFIKSCVHDYALLV